MKNVVNKLNRVLKFIAACFPSRLPQGMTEFNNWSDSIISLAKVPDNDSVRFALAFQIMHLPPTRAYKAKMYFILSLWKSAANQVADAKARELKDKQQAEMKKQAEATAAQAVASDEPQK